MITTKNIAKGSFLEVKIDDGIWLYNFKESLGQPAEIKHITNRNFIQFHFAVKGDCAFLFNEGNYTFGLKEENALLLYNPERDLPIHLQTSANSAVVSILISIKKLHILFSNEAESISFLSEENIHKKYYKDRIITPSMFIVLNQILNYNLNTSVRDLYFKGKTFELLSLYFNRSEDANVEQCPFLVDEANVSKIKQAKEIVIARMAEPPTLQEIADEVGLSLKKLKEGFKQIYGDSVFSFLLDYKLEEARKFLESGTYNVNEVGLKVGYSTASHFISAFKKKYGVTPKKYIQSS